MIAWLRKLIRSGDQLSVSPNKIIVGLGNPGPRYARSLHNAGFLTVDRIAGSSAKWKKWRNLASICTVEIEGVAVILVKPSTYMNLSGKAVRPLLRQTGLLPRDLLAIHDDMDLPSGKIRLRPGGGSAGGHRGVQSIIDHLQSRDFARLRIGVGRPPEGEDPAEYVLQPIPYEERTAFDALWKQAGDAASSWAVQGIETAMNKHN
ncbi:MAG: aminoacyl-tRNA hydrolase [Syntrophaceticus sp.]|jgi:PTH1 family peptidyl-tRNA hydrolase|nr:aminoacyl-tRNA hydrolase [Syntrophaceticus sp.]MDD3314156.1 aminoacyl-tRNA hydrolase [Syntrophaceticus sp.]MDD4359445.1 aminoacyl-tRNA hydrolase [Syntrophaceticus sp.]MDD4783057.1 aminoacyl-tRNA hydrolase [Syntrophaceticus sp.]HBG23320.1 aminoacyl-tRNA hydrolase [Peptococcaceae bacterium]